jgi:hypothetical protein
MELRMEMEEAGVRGVESRCVERKKEEEEKVRGKKIKTQTSHKQSERLSLYALSGTGGLGSEA